MVSFFGTQENERRHFSHGAGIPRPAQGPGKMRWIP